MGHPIDEAEVVFGGDQPDRRAFDRGLDTSLDVPEEEPLVGSVEDVVNGSQMGWSD